MKKQVLKKYIIDLVFSSLMLTLFVLLILSNKLSWGETAQSVVMLFILAFSLLATIYPLASKDKTTPVEWIIIAVCVSLLVAATITFSSVSSGQLRDPVIQISAAFLGGIITLYGVGLTIKYNRLEKQEDEIRKAKPNVFPFGEEFWEHLPDNEKYERYIEVRSDLSSFQEAKKSESCYRIAPLYLANSNLSMCTLKGIGINDKHFIVFQYDNVILKGTSCCFVIDYYFKFDQEIQTVQLVLGDMYGNTYSCYVSFELYKVGRGRIKEIDVTSVLKIKMMDVDKCPVFKKPE